MFREQLEWLEEAETLSLHLRANRGSQSNDHYRQGGAGSLRMNLCQSVFICG
jgi:hypothetical protein